MVSSKIFEMACVAAVCFGTAGARGQQPASGSFQHERLLADVRGHHSGVAIWWTGNNGWLIKANGLLIATDLVLEDPLRDRPAPISAAELAGLLDVSFVTHVHHDHFNGPTSKVLLEKSRCLFVLPKSCLDVAREIGIPEDRIVVARPREPFDIKGVRVEPLRALHGDRQGAVCFDFNLDDCGYLIHMGGKTILQPGDTVLLKDHLLLKHVDVLMFSPTEHNMQIDNSVTLINELAPDCILPQHRDTYPETEQKRYWAHAYTREVQARLSKDLQKRYHVVQMGERVDVALLNSATRIIP